MQTEVQEVTVDGEADAFRDELERLDNTLKKAEVDKVKAAAAWDKAVAKVEATEQVVGAVPMDAADKESQAATMALVAARTAVDAARLRRKHCEQAADDAKRARDQAVSAERKRLALKCHDRLAAERGELAKEAEDVLSRYFALVGKINSNADAMTANARTVLPDVPRFLAMQGVSPNSYPSLDLAIQFQKSEILTVSIACTYFYGFVKTGIANDVADAVRDGQIVEQCARTVLKVRQDIERHLDNGEARPINEAEVIPLRRSGGGIEQAFVSAGGEAA